MNFRRFIEQLEAFLALEQRGRWCAIGLVDINSSSGTTTRSDMRSATRLSIASPGCCANRSAPTT